MSRVRFDRLIAADRLALAALVATLLYMSLRTPIHSQGWAKRDLNDYTLNLLLSRQVAEERRYPFGFTYPPPSVLFRLLLGGLGFAVGGALWIALAAGGALFSLWASLHLLGWGRRRGKWCAALLAFLSVKYTLDFEFKYLNCNCLFLALVLGSIVLLEKKRDLGAGGLLAASIALKLYSVVFAPYLLCLGRLRSFASCCAFLTVFFLIAPVVYWGPGDAWRTTSAWLDAVRDTGRPDFPLVFQAYVISLHAIVVDRYQYLFRTFDLDAAMRTTRSLQVVWAAFVGGGFALLFFRRGQSPVCGEELLVRTSILLIAPLPLSPQLQPHHAVVLLPAAVVFATTTFDFDRSIRRRTEAAAILGLSWALVELAAGRIGHGFALHAVFMLFAGSLLYRAAVWKCRIGPIAAGIEFFNRLLKAVNYKPG